MNQNSLRIALTQMVWILSFIGISFFFYGGINKVPEWGFSIFMVPYLVSTVLLINVQEGEGGYNSVRNVKVLAGGSMFVFFAVKILIDYL